MSAKEEAGYNPRPWEEDPQFMRWYASKFPDEWAIVLQRRKYDKGFTQKVAYRYQGWRGRWEMDAYGDDCLNNGASS